jgi:hypothetical protein
MLLSGPSIKNAVQLLEMASYAAINIVKASISDDHNTE